MHASDAAVVVAAAAVHLPVRKLPNQPAAETDLELTVSTESSTL